MWRSIVWSPNVTKRRASSRRLPSTDPFVQCIIPKERASKWRRLSFSCNRKCSDCISLIKSDTQISFFVEKRFSNLKVLRASSFTRLNCSANLLLITKCKQAAINIFHMQPLCSKCSHAVLALQQRGLCTSHMNGYFDWLLTILLSPILVVFRWTRQMYRHVC